MCVHFIFCGYNKLIYFVGVRRRTKKTDKILKTTTTTTTMSNQKKKNHHTHIYIYIY